MDNKKFLDIIMICKKVSLSEHKYHALVKSKIDFRNIYNMINSCIDETNEDITSEILDIFYEMTKSCARRGNKEWMLSEQEFERTYKEILRVYLKYSDDKVKTGRRLLLFGNQLQYLSLSKDLNAFKLMCVGKRNNSVNLQFGKVSISRVITSNNVLNLSINGDNSKGIGGILIKDGKEFYHKVVDKNDEAELITRLLKYDYELAIIPNLEILAATSSISNIKKEEFDNSTYLDYLLLIKGLYVENIKPEDFWKVYYSEFNLNSLIKLMEENIQNSGVWIEFLSKIVNKASLEDKSKSDIEVMLKQIEDMIKKKFHTLRAIEYVSYLNHMDERVYTPNLEDVLKQVSRDL